MMLLRLLAPIAFGIVAGPVLVQTYRGIRRRRGWRDELHRRMRALHEEDS